MAHASDLEERAVREYGNAAIDHATAPGEVDDATTPVIENLDAAEEARKNADQKAEWAGHAYDEAKDLSSGSPRPIEGATDSTASSYKEAHPNAVEDVKKAEVMARAGDAAETEVAQHRTAAYELAAKAGDPDRDVAHDVSETQRHIEEAEIARARADVKEFAVGDVYDQTKDL